MAKRIIRTLKEKILKYFSFNRIFKCIDIFPKIVSKYKNEEHHKTTKRTYDITNTSK